MPCPPAAALHHGAATLPRPAISRNRSFQPTEYEYAACATTKCIFPVQYLKGPAMSEQAIIEIKDISVLFPVQGSRSPVRAVDGVSFDVLHRETFGIIGESGSGKSTVGRVLVCLQDPSGGTISHDEIGRAHV